MSVEDKKQLYSYYEGDIIEFQPSGNGNWHGYAIQNTADECPKEIAKALKDKGIITNSEYKKMINNKSSNKKRKRR